MTPWGGEEDGGRGNGGARSGLTSSPGDNRGGKGIGEGRERVRVAMELMEGADGRVGDVGVGAIVGVVGAR